MKMSLKEIFDLENNFASQIRFARNDIYISCYEKLSRKEHIALFEREKKILAENMKKLDQDIERMQELIEKYDEE